MTRFDPSLMAIFVTPVDMTSFDPTRPDESKFKVLHGRHTVAALQELDYKERDLISNINSFLRDNFIISKDSFVTPFF